MAIVKMKKLRLLALKSDTQELLQGLQRLNCVQVSECSADLEQTAELLRREQSGLAKCRTDHLLLQNAVKTLAKYAPVKSGFLTAKPEIGQDDFLDETELEHSLKISARLQQLEDNVRRISGDITRQQNLLEMLTPWLTLDVPLETAGTTTCAVVTGTVPAAIPLDSIKDTAEEAAQGELTVFPISTGKEQHYLLLLGMKDRLPAALDALRPLGYAPSQLAGMSGTVGDNISNIHVQIKALEQERQEQINTIIGLSSERNELKLCADRMGAKISLAEAQERLLGTELSVLLTGWVSEPELESLVTLLGKYECAWELEEPTAEEIEQNDVPVRLDNNAFTYPLNMVTEMYSLPAYGGVDPNPMMAPFFILFYGIMMADMGYGLLMIIAGLLVTKKAKPGGTMGHMFRLATLCGIATFIFGALTGGFFGDFLTQAALLINPESTFALPALFTPLEDTIMILIGAMALGFVHLMVGTVISFVEKAKKGNVMDGVWDEGTWWVIFAGVALAVLGIGNIGGVPVVLCIGGLMLIIGSGRNAKGIGKITSVFGALYNGVTGYFGDILSYSRLMALMLAGSVIAQVFNTIGAITGNLVTFTLIALVGNALNFGLNLLGCFVHDMRLQCLEFFGKFYQDGGKPFEPLNLKGKYVNIVAAKAEK